MWKDFSTDTYEHRYIGVLPRIKLPQRATSEKYHFNNHVQHDLLFVSRKSSWKKRWSLCSTSDMNFHSPRPIWLRVDINTKLQTWHHFPRKPASHLVAGWLNWTIFITEETALVLTGGGEPFTCMVLPFTFLSFDISDKNHYHSIIYNITCDKETHIISNIGFMPMDLTEPSCSPHAETAGLVKLWNGLWKTLLWFQLVRASLGLE